MGFFSIFQGLWNTSLRTIWIDLFYLKLLTSTLLSLSVYDVHLILCISWNNGSNTAKYSWICRIWVQMLCRSKLTSQEILFCSYNYCVHLGLIWCFQKSLDQGVLLIFPKIAFVTLSQGYKIEISPSTASKQTCEQIAKLQLSTGMANLCYRAVVIARGSKQSSREQNVYN